jgi:hypothetical protein
LHQSWVTPVQKVGAEHVESVNRPVQKRSDDRFGGRVPGQLVYVALHDRCGLFFTHE